MFLGTALDRRQQPVQVGKQNVARARQLHRKARIQHVRAGHPLMQETRFGSDIFGDVGQKRDYVMLGGALDFVDTLGVKIALFPDGFGGFFRDYLKLGQRVAGMRLDLKPDAVTCIVRPDGGHVGAGVAGDHKAVSSG